MFDFLLLAAGAGALYFLFKPPKKAETTQELLDYVDITPDGIIELPGYKYRLVIEVEPINMALRSFQEQAAIWLGFKNMINSLTLPTTFLIQTRHLNLKDYLDWLKTKNTGASNNIKKLADNHIEHLRNKAEGRHLRDRRYFVILKIDAASAGVESGIRVDNAVIGSILQTVPKPSKVKLSRREMLHNAETELFEAASIIRGALDGIEICTSILNKKAVVDFLYQTFNRDLAPFARLEEVDSQNMFSLFLNSLTPERVLASI